MSNYAKYRGRDTEQERIDLEEEIRKLTLGFSFLREFPSFAKSVMLAKSIHRMLPEVPELYAGWKSQIERASVSVCCNISEAVGRGSTNQLHQFLKIALGSLYETVALVLIAPVPVSEELKTLATETTNALLIELRAVVEDRISRL